jgi:hypothetical protein
MQVSRGRPQRLTSNQRGRGQEPVIVLGNIKSAVTVNMAVSWTEAGAILFRLRGIGEL